MAEDKKQVTNNQPLRESHDYAEAPLTQRITNDRIVSVSQRVPITPAPPRPPERDKK